MNDSTSMRLLDRRGGQWVIPNGIDTDQVTDGFHTFGELYDHRRALTAVLAAGAASSGDAWRSKRHHPDDDSMYYGYFIVGIQLPTGLITYHYKLEHWDDFGAVPELLHAPKWDGATPADTVTRLLDLARQTRLCGDMLVPGLSCQLGSDHDGNHTGKSSEGNIVEWTRVL